MNNPKYDIPFIMNYFDKYTYLQIEYRNAIYIIGSKEKDLKISEIIDYYLLKKLQRKKVYIIRNISGKIYQEYETIQDLFDRATIDGKKLTEIWHDIRIVDMQGFEIDDSPEENVDLLEEIIPDNIIIEKIWKDIDFFEIRITAKSRLASSTIDTYISKREINQFSKKVLKMAQTNKIDYYWDGRIKNSKESPEWYFKISNEDLLGHILIEIYMNINDSESIKQHSCCFYVRTELGKLIEFAEKIVKLNDGAVGSIVMLTDKINN